jgi:hypothetical protein
MISLKNYAGREQQSYSVMKMRIFTSLAMAKLVIGSITSPNLVAIRHTIDRLDQWYSTGVTRRHLRGYVKFKISIYILFPE